MPLSKHALQAVLDELRRDCFAFIGGYDLAFSKVESHPSILKYGDFYRWVEHYHLENVEYLSMDYFHNWLMEYRNEQRLRSGRDQGEKKSG